MKRAAILPLVAAMAPAGAAAHAIRQDPATPDLWLVLAIGTPALAYCLGVARLWRSAGIGRGTRLGRVAAFLLGWSAAVTAFVSPLHALAERSFFGHMLVHTVLMVVAAPLLVLARPLAFFAWALRRPTRSRLFRSRPARWLLAGAGLATAPIAATILQAAVLSIWHLPALFDLALRYRWIHSLQHVTLLAASLLFWWAMLEGRRADDGKAVMCLFATSIHGTLLGAMLTVAAYPWYARPGGGTPFGLSPIEDQQLGGLVMWVPAGLAYVTAGLAMFARWVRDASGRGALQPGRRPPQSGFAGSPPFYERDAVAPSLAARASNSGRT